MERGERKAKKKKKKKNKIKWYKKDTSSTQLTKLPSDGKKSTSHTYLNGIKKVIYKNNLT